MRSAPIPSTSWRGWHTSSPSAFPGQCFLLRNAYSSTSVCWTNYYTTKRPSPSSVVCNSLVSRWWRCRYVQRDQQPPPLIRQSRCESPVAEDDLVHRTQYAFTGSPSLVARSTVRAKVSRHPP